MLTYRNITIAVKLHRRKTNTKNNDNIKAFYVDAILTLINSGYYAFVETSAPRQVGDKAVLTSMQFDSTTGSGRCLSFWYHMYGASIGKFNVFVKTIVGTSVTGTRLLWQLRGNQGNQWSQGRIPLRIGTSFQVGHSHEAPFAG